MLCRNLSLNSPKRSLGYWRSFYPGNVWISLQTVFYLPKRHLARVNFAHCVNVLLRGLDNSLLCDITMNKCITYVVIWYASVKLHSIRNSGFLELSLKWIFTQMHLIWPLWRHSVLGIRITFVGKTPSSIVYIVDSLSEVLYYVISGGRVSNHRHLVSLTFAVSRIRPSHVIVMMGSNDLDSADPYFNVECLVFRLIAFLTQLRNTNILVSITMLSHDQICAHWYF